MRKRIFALLLSLALVLGLCACSKAPTWQEQYDLGVKYLTEGSYEEAIIAFTAAIDIDPKRAEAYLGRGDVYWTQALAAEASAAAEQYRLALADYETVRSMTDPLLDLCVKLAKGYTALEDQDKALEILQYAIDAFGREQELLDILAELSYELDEDGQLREIDWREYQYEVDHIVWTLSPYQYFIPDQQREEKLRSLSATVQRLEEFYSERIYFLLNLERIYYAMGDLEVARQVRGELYQLTGEAQYNPDGRTEHKQTSGWDETYTYDAWGNKVRLDAIFQGSLSVRAWEYDSKGKLLVDRLVAGSYEEVTTYEYGSDGRIQREIYTMTDNPANWSEYVYEGDTVVQSFYTDEGVYERVTYTINEYGGVEDEQVEDLD